MTDTTIRMRAARRAALLLLGCGALGACDSGPAPSAGSRLRVFAADLAGASKSCNAAKPTLSPGKTADASLSVGNDGGWCGISVAQEGPKPYAAGLLTKRPAHGAVTIHSVGDYTRIDYVPDRGFAGADAFSVKLLPGSAEMNVGVTVAAAGGK